MFGGDWTQQKLAAIREYLCAYATALKKQNFELAYVDAFAGTGYREQKEIPGSVEGFFPELAEEETQKFLDGSPRIALQVEPPFDRYIFVEKSKKKLQELEKLKDEFPEQGDRIEVHHRDANEFLQEWCADRDWRNSRAVVFLDPFGMQVDWSTMEAIAGTKSIDLWVLFPVGIGVNRLLAKDPTRMPEEWRACLSRMFGSDDWFDAFYKERPRQSFFGEEKEHYKVCTIEMISEYYHRKLGTIFPAVAENPLTIKNSTNTPLFQLCFAAANPGRGGEIALRIAQHILGRE